MRKPRYNNIATRLVPRITLSEMAHQAIRRNIITGALAPGSKVVVTTLAKALNLSPTPINEALAALEREGLVVNLPHRGYFVWTVTPKNIEEIFSVREVFELLAVRSCASASPGKLAEQLQKNLRQARQALRANDLTRFSDLDFEFHRIIWSTLNNSLATRIGDLIDGQVRLLVATTARAPGRFRGACEEHCEIYEAIRRGNAARAERAMKKHIRNAKTALERAVAEKSKPASSATGGGTPPPRAQPGLRRPRAPRMTHDSSQGGPRE